MTLLRTVLLFAAIFFFREAQATWGFTQSYIVLDNGGGPMFHAGSFNPDAAASFNNNYYGSFNSLSTFVLEGGQVRSFENGSSNVCGSTLYYRVYRTCDAPGAFSSVSLSSYTNLGSGNEQWEELSAGIDLVASLTNSGTYVLEAYWEMEGNLTNPVGCGEFTADNNAGLYWRAYFDFDLSESFSDSNFSAAPVWSGDTGNWQVVANSDVANLNGTELLQTRTLRLNVASGSGTQHMSTPVSSWSSQQDWSYWIGRRGQAATTANRAFFWLYANEANLESATVDGYRIQFGDDSGGDELQLQSVTNGVGTTILSSSGAVTNGVIDYGYTVRVTRNQSGLWTLYTSALPTLSASGQNARSCPHTASTVLQGSVTNTTYTPSGSGFIGVTGVHTSGGTSRIGLEFDNIRFEPIDPDTEVSFNASTGTVNEDDGTYTITVDILNPSAVNATVADVVLIGGDGGRVNGFTTQTVNFPAGSAASQNVVLTVTDNSDCDDIGVLTFELQNVSGGFNAFANSPTFHDLTVVDDDMGYGTMLIDDFEDNDVSDWVSTPSGYWESSNFIPCNGVYSARSGNVNVAGHSSFSYDLDKHSMSGVLTNWRFNLRYSQEPSLNNKFLVYLAANESDLTSSTVDGYAVGVDPINIGDPDIITLWEVVNGSPSAAIVTTSIDWGSLPHSKVGFEIIRDENGNWDLMIDEDGDFDNLVSYGSSTNNSITDADYFGIEYLFTAGLDNALAIDDVSITEKACRAIYYSQLSGNVSDPIWDEQPIGVGGTISSGAYTRLVIQNGHSVSLDGILNSDDITIESGATLNGGSYSYRVHGLWINDGTFNAGTGIISFRGSDNQLIAGTSTTAFNNLGIDNNGFTVTIVGGGSTVSGIVTPDEGTLNANGLLTLLSTATSTASIGEIKSGADVTGTLTLQRFVPSWTYNGIGWNSGGTWVNLGNPMVGALTLADWNDDMITTGFLGSDFPPPYTFVNVVSYDETVPGNRDLGFVNAGNITDVLENEDGYFVFLTYSAHTFDATGTIHKNSIAHNVSYTNTGAGVNDGWNLLTNLYPSEVDWDQLVNNGSGVTTYSVYDRDMPGYKAYNGITQVGTASRYLPSGQSFFTQAFAPGDFLMYEEGYKTNTNAAFERSRPESSFIAMRIEKNGMADEAVLVFREGSVPQFETLYDGTKLENTFVPEAPEMAFVAAGDELLTIQTLTHNEYLNVPVWIDAPEAGVYSMLINEVANMPMGACITIEDLATGQTHAIENGSTFNFELSEAFTGVRFVIHSTKALDVNVTNASCNGAEGMIELVSAVDWNFNIFDESGNSMFSAVTNNVEIHLPAGTYSLETELSGDACGSSVHEIEITQPSAISLNAGGTVAACNSETGEVEFALQNAGNYSFELLNSNGVVVESGSGNEIAKLIQGLPADQYELIVQTTCEVLESTIELRDPSAVTVEIQAPTSIVQNTAVEFLGEENNAEILTWTINGSEVATGESFSKIFAENGLYLIGLHGSNANCSDHDQVLIEVKSESVSIEETVDAVGYDIIGTATGFDVLIGEAVEGSMLVEVFNSAGQLVFSKNISNATSGRHSIDSSVCANGAYTVRVAAGGSALITEVIIK